ncbi:hypothetical protein OG884_25610 [Streptosporangium sp. NBC_01755]|uniref:hypothetical protein n=1 Tax=unclassified Streptosporangium TaxID=2632669 RepID=UPI002DDB8718|nr:MULTISPECIES: hypothetical protein [unclassified Streptosporangium]WSA23552.1 hypothetical protein OIE13_21610 [Streptosporangium sp. NBC_01810]WSC98238.1 hypothetical protein OG884_25610 [Streptosporangium sp. NBC_01755]
MTRRPADTPHQVSSAHVHDELAARRARRARDQRLRNDPHIRLLEREHGVRLTVEELQAADRQAQETQAQETQAPRHEEPPVDEETRSLQLLVWRRLGPRGFQGFMRELEEMEAELARSREDDWDESS